MDGLDGQGRTRTSVECDRKRDGLGGVGLVDVLVVVGLVLVGAGCWGLWGWASAALVVGGVLLGLGLAGAVRGGGGDGGREGEGEEDVDGG